MQKGIAVVAVASLIAIAIGIVVVTQVSADIVIASAWVMAAYWVLGAAAMIVAGSEARLTHRLWLSGCCLFLFHACIAIRNVHGWSHSEAFNHVEQTSGFGAGIYVNYLFGVVWIADAAFLLGFSSQYASRPRWVGWLVHGFLTFIMFNGTVVYANSPMRWVALFAFCVLAGLICIKTKRHSRWNAIPARPDARALLREPPC